MPLNQPIAIFDSGVGGLSVYKAIKKLLPNEKIVYLADGGHFPYGDKKPALVRRLTLRCLKFLINPVRCEAISLGLSTRPKLIIVACNTATVSGMEYYKKMIPNIPIIGVVPVVKTAAERTKNNRIGIISTINTANSVYQKHLIAKYCPGFHVFSFPPLPTTDLPRGKAGYQLPTRLVLNIGCPNLVHHVEKGVTEGPEIEKELHHILKPIIEAKCDVLALGCTHYPFLKKTIDKIIGPKVLFLDSGGAVARHAKRILEQNQTLAPTPSKPSTSSQFSSTLFLTTGNPDAFAQTIKKLLHIDVRTKKVRV